jgi:hypothetical protein
MLHGDMNIYVDGDDKVSSDELAHIGFTCIGDSYGFDVCKATRTFNSRKELVEALRRILKFLTNEAQT